MEQRQLIVAQGNLAEAERVAKQAEGEAIETRHQLRRVEEQLLQAQDVAGEAERQCRQARQRCEDALMDVIRALLAASR
jgi:hypothetical protein